METRELRRIEQLLPGSAELRDLWTQHQALEHELERLNTLRSLTPQERTRRSELKKRKLAGRDRIQAILRGC